MNHQNTCDFARSIPKADDYERVVTSQSLISTKNLGQLEHTDVSTQMIRNMHLTAVRAL